MDVQESEVAGVAVLEPKGRLDSVTSPSFETLILGRVDGGARLAVDFAGLDYISSAGLRVLLMAAKRSKAGGGRLALCNLKPAIRDVFEMSGFGKLFLILPSREEAVAALA